MPADGDAPASEYRDLSATAIGLETQANPQLERDLDGKPIFGTVESNAVTVLHMEGTEQQQRDLRDAYGQGEACFIFVERRQDPLSADNPAMLVRGPTWLAGKTAKGSFALCVGTKARETHATYLDSAAAVRAAGYANAPVS